MANNDNLWDLAFKAVQKNEDFNYKRREKYAKHQEMMKQQKATEEQQQKISEKSQQKTRSLSPSPKSAKENWKKATVAVTTMNQLTHGNSATERESGTVNATLR
jgi:Spy/CpxP family protein refolding chaperone